MLDMIILDCYEGEFFIEDFNSFWKGNFLYNFYKEVMMFWEWYKELFDYVKEKGLLVFSMFFDLIVVDFLEILNFFCYKVVFFENIDYVILVVVVKIGKFVIVFIGMVS